MKFSARWNRFLHLPAPRRPVRRLLTVTAVAFVLGLIVGQFLPDSLGYEGIPMRIDFPFRAAALAGVGELLLIGTLFLGPAGRKRCIFVSVAVLVLGIAVIIAVIFPLLVGDFGEDLDDLESKVTRLMWSVVAMGVAVVIGPLIGWARWCREETRREMSRAAASDETAHLLSSPANADRLGKALQDHAKGNIHSEDLRD